MPCPVCDKPSEKKWRPFCSRRCADLDLGKWLTGGYTLPDSVPAEDESQPPPPDRKPH